MNDPASSTTSDDRAAQISARLVAATPPPWRTHRSKHVGGKYVTRDEANAATIVHATETWAEPADADLIANAPADLAWLLAQRATLLARVEVAETQVRIERAWVADHRQQMDEVKVRVEDAERAGAVKALRARSADTKIRGDIGKPGQLETWQYLAWWANKVEDGADL